MGIPSYTAVTDATGYTCPFNSILTGPAAISASQVKSLAGNSICVPVFGYLLTHVLAHLRRGRVDTLCDDI